MKVDKRIVGIGIVGLFILTGLSGCIDQSGIDRSSIIIPTISAIDYDNPKYTMASYYTSEGLEIESNVPQYELPLDLVQKRYGERYTRILHDVQQTDDLRVLDYDGHKIFLNISFSEIGSPIFYEPTKQ